MFNCTDKTSRYYIGRLTALVINKAFKIYEDVEDKDAPKVKELYDAVDELTFLLVKTLASSDCQKNWMRLENYLKMINEIGLGGKIQAQYMRTKFDIVVELIDFMLGNKSPIAIAKNEKRTNMGSGGMTNPAPFEPLVGLVCYLIRFSMTPEMKQERHLWDSVNMSPPPTLLGYDLNGDRGSPERYPLSDEAFKFFTHQEFIDKVLKEGYECEEFGKALAHFCYKNEKFSKQVAKLLLKGISRNDYEKVKNYLDVVTQVALVRDHLQRTRLEWIFGVGCLNSQTATITNPG